MHHITFGTDGIRGVFGESLTPQTAFCLGAALGKRGSVLIGRDSRPSSPLLCSAAAQGVMSVGGTFTAVGLVTTPALFYLLTRTRDAHAIMVTASHNPPEHNGLKVFSRKGKPSREELAALEREIALVKAPSKIDFPLRETSDPLRLYREFFKEKIGSLAGAKVAVDFACGAGCAFRDLLSELGAEVTETNADPVGSKINLGCGALHPEHLAEVTRRTGATMGMALDGDGDRLIVADGTGNLWNGDRIAYYLACKMKEQGTLKGDRIVMTVMTNGGVIKSLRARGIACTTCAVGDSAVAEAMQREGVSLGGEQSGHLILRDYLMTGDALLAGAVMLKTTLREGPLEKETPPLLYPQVLLNLPVKNKHIAKNSRLSAIAKEIDEELGEGRLLLRASGTENLLRILAEHPDKGRAEDAAQRLRRVISEEFDK